MIEELQYEIIRSNIKNLYIQIKDGNVVIRTPKRFSQSQIEEIIIKKQNWIKKNLQKSLEKQYKKEQYTLEEFTKIVQENVKDLILSTGLKPNRVRIKQIKYAWGSCSIHKNISINQKLICYSQSAIRYVILHELCHLKYMNHSKDFWNLVESYMPNYKQAKKELRQ